MTFQDDNGNLLEVDGEFGMTKQAVSVFNGDIKGDVSLNFNVDNNSVNRKILNYDGPQMLNQVAFTKQSFNRLRNGNILDRGFIVIQSEDDDSLNCFYGSGNSNWVQLLQGLITELDYSSYATIINRANIIALNSASSGIIFPFVDWCYNMQRGSNVFAIVGTSPSIVPTFVVDVNNDITKPFHDFYPCFYISSLMSEIFSQNGLKISGDLIDDPLYKSLIITPSNGIMKRDYFKDVITYGSSQSMAPGTTRYTSLSASSNPEGLFSSNRYTANKKASLIFTITEKSSDAAINGISIYKNGSFFYQTASGSFISGTQHETPLITSVPGDYFDFYLDNGDAAPHNGTINVTIKVPEYIFVNDYVEPGNFLPSLKAIDIAKFCFNYFGCVVTYDEYSKTVTANIIENFKPESASDWSKYSVSARSEYTVNQAKNNYLKLEQSSTDTAIQRYNSTHKVGFGEGNIQTGNTLKEDNTIFQLPFSAASFGQSKAQFWNSSVNLVNLVDSGDPILYSAISGVAPIGDIISNSTFTIPDGTIFSEFSGSSRYEIVRITNSNNVNLGYFYAVNSGATDLTVIFPFSATDTGKIYRQEINYQDCTNILSVKPSTTVSDFSNLYSQLTVNSESVNGQISSFSYATFTKQLTGKPIDQWKANLAIDNPDSGGFIDPTIKQLYFNKISKFLQNPNIRERMLLPESVYQGFKFDQFIYLKTEKLTGYFFVQSIVNYVDGNTPVEVNLYML